jgi:FkbH-like protein
VLHQALARARGEKSLGASTALAAAARKAGPEAGLRPVRLAVLRNFTVEPLLPALEAEAVLSGMRPELYLGEFDAIAADVFDPQSQLFQFKPDLIVVALWLETLAPRLTHRFVGLEPDEVQAELEAVLAQVGTILQRIRASSKAPVVVNNFPLLSRPTLGVLDAQLEGGQGGTLAELNRRLLRLLRQVPDAYLADYAFVFAELGFQSAFDERYWHKGRAPLGQKTLLPIAQIYGSVLRALQGKAKKCLVLDCDNTLWGGIVGEDGPGGIALGTTYPGSCFRDFQREILNLHDRGVILALCSKNNEADVLDLLDTHPEMLLERQHLAGWRINWEDKAKNLRSLVEELNIGLDSVVFVDDSPFEIDWVRSQLPAVHTVLVPKEHARLRTLLLEEGLFDTLSLSDEDRQRNRLYVDERQRRGLEASAASYDEYLKQLGLTAEIGSPGEGDIARVAQLTQKTNQFNLTTRRYTEANIRDLLADPQSEVFSLRLSDKVAEMGLVAVAILRYRDRQAELDTLLMSCRVLGRGVEDLFLAWLQRHAREARGATSVVGSFIATAKNQQVTDFYPKRGFAPLPADGSGASRFIAEPIAPPAFPDWIRLKS